MLPLQFGLEYFEKRDDVVDGELPLTFDIQTTEALGFEPIRHHFFTLIYGTEEQRQMLDTSLLFLLKYTKKRTVLVDFEGQVYTDNYASFDEVYTASGDDIERLKLLLAEYVKLAGSKAVGEQIFMYIPNLRLFFEKKWFDDR